MKTSRFACLNFGLWLALGSSAFSATTLQPGGNIRSADGWDNGAPSESNPGTINVDGIISGGTTVSLVGNETITQTAGVISDIDPAATAGTSPGFNYAGGGNGGGTWNISGGGISSRLIQANNSTINISGGFLSIKAAANGQLGVVNTGILNISGTAILDATGAGSGFVVATQTGIINFAPDWTGYFTSPNMHDTSTAMDWEVLLVDNARFAFNNSTITQEVFDATFTVSGVGGRTLSLIPEPSSSLFAFLGLGLVVRRRR